ncbi:secretin N-terminal domain-containing protein [Fimbriiglobus ruber]|uniref:NolW-like domain-containing protein n=1 Tax=Fimbriiglobus ruber TaxID=1908690 RepID=A0A225E170_9BACT|nr:secretin N-terminal domain-containing protein [Fimbriiglobus ruber]OWK47311.1 hypothetical protein FRUB_01010 [Fimbriiglobus ruber]
MRLPKPLFALAGLATAALFLPAAFSDPPKPQPAAPAKPLPPLPAESKPGLRVKVFKLKHAETESVRLALADLLGNQDDVRTRAQPGLTPDATPPQPPNHPVAGLMSLGGGFQGNNGASIMGGFGGAPSNGGIAGMLGLAGVGGLPPNGFGGISGVGGFGGQMGGFGGNSIPLNGDGHRTILWRVTTSKNVLIVRGTERHVQLAEEIVAALDREEKAALPRAHRIRTFELKNADAQTVVNTLRVLEFDGVKFSTAGDRLILGVIPEVHQKTVADLILDLDVKPDDN